MNPGKLTYRPHIDGLRAIAVLSVVAYHAFPGLLRGGFIGVDIFFVISGFLISTILYREFGAQGESGLRVILRFYGRRIRRIFPALLVVLIACLALGFWTLLPSEFKKLSSRATAASGFYINLILAREAGYFNETAIMNPLLHLWSLAVEEQFYLLWPVAIWIACRCRIRVLAVAVFLVAFSFFWNADHSDAQAAANFFLPQTRLWELLVGAIAAAVFPSLAAAPAGGGAADSDGVTPSPWRISQATRVHLGNVLSILGLLLIGSGLFFITNQMAYPSKWTLLPTIGAAFIVCSDESAWVNRRILSLRVLVGVGLISYPLYLWHWPLLSYSHLSFERPDAPFLKASVLLASVVLAYLTYRIVERPIRHGAHVPLKVAVLSAAMAAVAGLGCFIGSRGGFPSRFPPLAQGLAEFNYTPTDWQRHGYFLTYGEDETDFKDDSEGSAQNKPKLYLWGDSHAAGLYPGLEEVFGGKYNIVQRTGANLAPFVGEKNNQLSSHPKVNQFILDSIRRDKAACVVIEANWPTYEWKEIEGTIDQLQAAGIRNIVLVGPVPQWYGSLPQQLFNYIRRHRNEPVPKRLSTGLKPEPPVIDVQMAALSKRLGVKYISPCAILENQEGCLTRTGDSADSLLVFDSAHLTTVGSKYLVAHFPDL